MRKTTAALCAALLAVGLGAASAGPALAKGPKPKIKKVVFSGTPAAPTITVTGIGLGSLPIEHAEAPLECFPPEASPGNDYGESAFFEDLTQGWAAGKAGDCIGLVFSTWTETEVVYGFGSGYREYTPLTKADSFSMTLNGHPKAGKVHFAKPTV